MDTKAKLISILENHVDNKALILDDAKPVDMLLDSLDVVAVAMDIEKEIAIPDFTDAEIEKFHDMTVTEIAEFIESKREPANV